MRTSRYAVLAAGIMLAFGGGARAGSVLLTGPTSTAGTYSPSDLANLGSNNPGNVVTFGTLTGYSLWSLLGGANASSSTSPIYGSITTTTPSGYNGKNAILRYYIVGTASDGTQYAVSAGAIDPNFGGTGTPVFVAYQNSGVPLSAPTLVVPATATELANLSSLQLRAFPAIPTGAGGESSSVILSGNVNNPGSYTAAMLQDGFTPVQQTVGTDTYTGIPLSTFVDSTSQNAGTQIVVGQGTDGYEVVYGLGELTNLNDIVAYAATGTDFPADGVARTILPADNAHGRFISNLLNLEALDWNSGAATTDTHDFNADGVGDILWLDTSGNAAMWLMSAGQFSSGAALGNVGTSWKVAGTRDFNADGNADILWLDNAGDVAVWLMNGTAVTSYESLGNVGTQWKVAGTGDFNGDGTGDVLWRNATTGDLAIWLMSDGAFSTGIDLGVVPSVWAVAGTGDFNGDGTTDILWRNTSTGALAIWFMNNAQMSSGLNVGSVSTTWTVVGTGDLNGDGVSDILWRDSAGNLAIWLMNSSGQMASGTAFNGIPATWSMAETGDFNGDGTSDILWIDGSGNLGVWLMNGTSLSSGIGLGNVGASWTVQGANAD